MVPLLVWRGQVVTSGADLHAVQNEELTNRKCREAQAGRAFRVGCGGSGLGVTHNAAFSPTWQVFETVRWAESWWRWEGGAAIHVASWLIVSQAVCVCVYVNQSACVSFRKCARVSVWRTTAIRIVWASLSWLPDTCPASPESVQLPLNFIRLFFFLVSEFCHIRKEFKNMHYEF